MSYKLGYAILTDPSERSPLEFSVFTCSHCQRIVHCRGTDPVRAGGHCKMCDALVCKTCYGQLVKDGICKPWQQRCTEIEAAARRQMERGSFFRSMGLE